MTINEASISFNKYTRMHYQDRDFHNHMFSHIRSYLPLNDREIIIVCIGTDRCTGDALGPFVGTNMLKLNPRKLTIYGSIHSPVHAKNLVETMRIIYASHKHPFIIAIDASLGKASSVGSVLTGIGALQPGAALKKDLPKVGHIYIAGIVNTSGFMDFQVLQNTRLSIVIDIAHEITRLLHHIDLYLYKQEMTV